jgi:sterol desaturase/sphingolipid hydroxylase (fatty acid hydroxylase superfamily)
MEMPETCRVLFQNEFEKLVYLVGFIIRKFVTMHCHMNVKNIYMTPRNSESCQNVYFILGLCV